MFALAASFSLSLFGQEAAQTSSSLRDPACQGCHSFHLEGDAATILKQVLHAYGVDVVWAHPSIPLQRSIRFDVEGADLSTAGYVLGLMTNSFFVPINEHLALVVADTPENRSAFSKKSIATISINDLVDSKESEVISRLAATVFELPGASLHDDLLTVRGDPEMLDQISRTTEHLYRPAPRIRLVMRSYLVTSTNTHKTGIELPTKFTLFNVLTEANKLIQDNASVVEEIISEGLASEGDVLTIASLLIAGGYAGSSVLGSSSVYFGGGRTATGVQFDSASVQASLQRSKLERLQEQTLLLADGSSGKLRFGQRYPIETSRTSVTTSSTSSSSNTTTPSIQYEDLGVTLEAKVHLSAEGDACLELHQTIRGLQGQTANDIPILDNQEFATALSIPHNGSALLISDVSQSETRAIRGLASAVPTESKLDKSTTQLVIVVTPYVLDARSDRALHYVQDDNISR
ncbi:hypothetical protein AB4Y89_09795 [Terriglobus sp. 2YAB30_2]|uniref:hypothetical protein n=1 Tax=Terriglobus sp. 2YAB30_2 TaxID=3233023 RepID=UPI003F99FE1F